MTMWPTYEEEEPQIHTVQKQYVLLPSHNLSNYSWTEQGELEHQTPKAWYKCTDKKMFIKQLTEIECHQIRLWRLKQKCSPPSNSAADKVEKSVKEHYHIGKCESLYEDIGTFLCLHVGDPAVKVFFPDLIWTTSPSHSCHFRTFLQTSGHI